MARSTGAAPNVLWYCTDQQRFDTIGALGNAYVHTPRIDRFIAEGAAFTHAFCQSPICTPSRSSFLTGMYPSFNRVNGNGNLEYPEEAARRLVPRILAEAGYECGLAGKLHLAGASGGYERRCRDGYRYFAYSHAPRRDYFDHTDYYQWLKSKGVDPHEVLKRLDGARFPHPPGDMPQGGLFEPTEDLDNVAPELHQTTWCTEMGIAFIDEARRAGRPWLLSVNPFDPHPPHDPPRAFYRRFDPGSLPRPDFRKSDIDRQNRLSDAGIDFQVRARPPEEWRFPETMAAYYAMIELLDEQFGRLLDHLDAVGERENTIVIFTSDHGEMLGDHGLVLKGCRFYEPLVRVPLVISWPGRFRTGLVSEALVELVDLAPTVLESAGIALPPDLHGRSLVSILTGCAPSGHHRDSVRCEYYNALEGFYRAIGHEPDRTFATMYRDVRWKLVLYHGCGVGELYDLENDPGEKIDLWDDPGHRAERLALLEKAFDATVRAMDHGPKSVMLS